MPTTTVRELDIDGAGELGSAGISLAEVLSSLSYALDLTSGQAMGHSQQTCLIGVKLAERVGLSDEDVSQLYHALIMKDAGCSSNAARMYEIFGSDEIAAKRATKITDWTNLLEAAKYADAYVLPHSPLLARAARMLSIALDKQHNSQELFRSRCDRGAQIAMDIGLGERAAECIRHLDEHWDGNGAPQHLKGERIGIFGRIACLSQTMAAYAQALGRTAAYDAARKRSGRWFDPSLVQAAISFEHDDAFWSDFEDPQPALLRLPCGESAVKVTTERIDAVCSAFAQIVDAKSNFTAEHSRRVCGYATAIGNALGFETDRLATLRRAALLHDVGKLGVSNAILDKNGKPDNEEWIAIRRHPYYTQQVLGRIRGFRRITEIASAHHERLDGKGYHRGLAAEQLDMDMRVLAAADVYDALSADRPYRAAMTQRDAFAILDRESGSALDPDCVAALKSAVKASPTASPDLPLAA